MLSIKIKTPLEKIGQKFFNKKIKKKKNVPGREIIKASHNKMSLVLTSFVVLND